MSRGAALVTGASRGLGAASARALAAAGWPVAVNYASDDAGARAVVESIVESGGTVYAARFDITDADAVKQGVGAVQEALGPLAVLVNNATGAQPVRPIEEQTVEDYQLQFDYFVAAPLLLLQQALPAMRATGYGRIINVGSEVVDLGNPELGHYVAGKAAMVGLTRSWARELGPEGITVNVVEPGWIPMDRDADDPDLPGYLSGVPMGRGGEPADVGAAVAWLASPEAKFVTGQRIAVNGGNTMQ